jgi:hypothetical protein
MRAPRSSRCSERRQEQSDESDCDSPHDCLLHHAPSSIAHVCMKQEPPVRSGALRDSGLAIAPALAQDAIALIETLTSPTQRVEMMSYARVGEIIRLSPHQTMVISYGDSCVREIITGGTITIGREQSEVRFGEVKRTVGKCATSKFEVTGADENVGARAFRGVH